MSIPEKKPFVPGENVPLSPTASSASLTKKQADLKSVASGVKKAVEKELGELTELEMNFAIRSVYKHEILAKKSNFILLKGFNDLLTDVKIRLTDKKKEIYNVSGKNMKNEPVSCEMSFRGLRNWANYESQYEQKPAIYTKVHFSIQDFKTFFSQTNERRYIISASKLPQDLAILTYCVNPHRKTGEPAILVHEKLRRDSQGFIYGFSNGVERRTECLSIDEYLKQHPYIDHEKGYTKPVVAAKEKQQKQQGAVTQVAKGEQASEIPDVLNITEEVGMNKLQLYDRMGTSGAFLIRALSKVAVKKPIVDGKEENLKYVLMYCDAKDSNQYKRIFFGKTADGGIIIQGEDRINKKLPKETLVSFLEGMAKSGNISLDEWITE